MTQPGRVIVFPDRDSKQHDVPKHVVAIVIHVHASIDGLERAGASALELNLYGVVADPHDSAERIERRYCALVRQVKVTVGIPLAVKIGPFFTALAHTASELTAAGADGLVLFNRFYQPDLDLEDLEVAPRLSLSTSEDLRLPLRWIAILNGRVDASLAATSGVHSAEDALKALLAGADVAMLASAPAPARPAGAGSNRAGDPRVDGRARLRVHPPAGG